MLHDSFMVLTLSILCRANSFVCGAYWRQCAYMMLLCVHFVFCIELILLCGTYFEYHGA